MRELTFRLQLETSLSHNGHPDLPAVIHPLELALISLIFFYLSNQITYF